MSRTCRVCKQYGGPLLHYAVRHYVHPACGFKRWGGPGFLEKIQHDWMIASLPYRLAVEYGVAEEVEAASKRNQAAADELEASCSKVAS